MTSDRLFVYGTLMRGFDHPMAKLLSRSADFIGEAQLPRPALSGQALSGLVLSDDPADIVSRRTLSPARAATNCSREFDMYEACGAGLSRSRPNMSGRCCTVTLADGSASEAWTYVYNWPVDGPAAHRLGKVSGAVATQSSRASRTSTSRST